MHPKTLDVEELSPISIAIDFFIVCCSLVSTPILINHFKPFHRGFFCDDDTIRYPCMSSTVSDANLYGLASAIPVLTISGSELLLAYCNESLRRGRVLVSGRAVPAWAVRWVRHILLYAFGLGCQEWLVNLGKFTAGRLRPHFLAACNPDVLCNATGRDPHAYIEDYTCMNPEGHEGPQYRLSFPSGHAAMAFYAGIFTLLYIEKRINWPHQMVVLKTTCQAIVFALAWFTALSRIPDHKHHWGDVLAGSSLGLAVAFFWVFYVLRVRTDTLRNNVTPETTYVFPPEATEK